MSPAQLLLPLALVAMLVPAAVLDVRRRIIPDRLLLPSALLALLLGLASDARGTPARLLAAVLAAAFLLGPALAAPGSMGLGDVKLAGVMGLHLGASVVGALVVALAAGTLVGAGLVIRRGWRHGRRATIPFAPCLALGGVAAALGVQLWPP